MSITTIPNTNVNLGIMRRTGVSASASISLSRCVRRTYIQNEADSTDTRYAGTSFPWRVGLSIDGNNSSIPATHINYTPGKITISLSHLRGCTTWMASATNDRYLWTEGFVYVDKYSANWKFMFHWQNVKQETGNTGIGSGTNVTSYTYNGYTFWKYPYSYGYNFGTGYSRSRPCGRS